MVQTRGPISTRMLKSGIDPYRYLAWLLRRLPLAQTVDDYNALLLRKMFIDLR
ncbi:transposase domain-containing protein [Paraburkholderia sp. BL6665CI2N2]|uniref:transposase domain-containing protein n=1 Tax=Paraburkholderia sp. BL6665CI2N2 TaxID=1938806 RepID=UPI0010662020|nr:transposase domain-containing protein [Paraburkholderia sp. BL6665CI2N2]